MTWDNLQLVKRKGTVTVILSFNKKTYDLIMSMTRIIRVLPFCCYGLELLLKCFLPKYLLIYTLLH